jgi:CRISPR system Cascade subunit CasE
MIQLRPDLGRLMRWATREGLVPARGEADLGYVLHAALAGGFGPLAPKPFALQAGRTPSVLGYSAQDGKALRTQADSFAVPEIHNLLALDGLACKAMPAAFLLGQRLGFAVRARPVVRTDREGDRNRVVERDAFLLSPPGSNRGEVYTSWLARHLEAGGARVVMVALEAFRLTAVQRRADDRGFRSRCGPDATFGGILEVSDPDAFATLLARGVGRHRAFGYGMLLLRPT